MSLKIFFLYVILLTFKPDYKAAGTTYYFSTSGNDVNDGLSPALPKRTMQAAVNLMSAGNTVLFKRGDAWYHTNYELNLSNKTGTSSDPITIDAYGSGRKPVIADMELITSGWINAGSSLWKHELTGYSDAVHCYVNGESKLKVDITSLDENTKFSVSTGYIFLYSTSAPGIVEVVPNDGKGLIYAENISYVTIRNIDFRGGGKWLAMELIAPSDHFILDSCLLQEFSSYAIKFDASTNTGHYHNAPSVINCYINKVWSKAENKTTESPGGDGILFEDAVEGGIARGNKVIDVGHTGIGINGSSLAHHGSRHIIIEQNEVYLINCNYNHAFSIGGVEGKGSYNIVRRNYFHDFTTQCHVEGDHNMVYSNVIVNVDVSPTPTKHANAMDFCPWKFNWNTNVHVCHDNMIVNNTIYDCEENPIVVSQYSPAVLGANNVIKNNLIVKWNNTDHLNKPNYGIMVTNAASVYPGIENNGFWNGSSSGKVINQGPGTFNTNEANLQSNCKSNLQLQPVFVDEANLNFRLTSNSPYRAGGQVLTNMGPGYVDFDGRTWNTSSPSIGAFQYIDSLNSTPDLKMKSEIIIYPNPSHDYIRVSGIHGYSEIVNIFGESVWQGEIIEDQQINITNLRKGFYLIRNNDSISKLIVMK